MDNQVRIEPTLDECLHQVCTHCGKEFQWHRVTPAGNSYCLELNHQAEKDNAYFNRGGAPLHLEGVPVKMLRRSPFGKRLGQVVHNMMGYIEVSA